jgi:hypothetical protein
MTDNADLGELLVAARYSIRISSLGAGSVAVDVECAVDGSKPVKARSALIRGCVPLPETLTWDYVASELERTRPPG